MDSTTVVAIGEVISKAAPAWSGIIIAVASVAASVFGYLSHRNTKHIKRTINKQQ